MNRKIGVWLLMIVGLIVGMGMREARAASTDTIQLIVTPSVIYSVQITSADANIAYNFGTVGLDVTTRSERPATVTNTGNVVSRWQVSAQNETTWSLGTATGTQDVAVLKALFNAKSGAMPIDTNYQTQASTLTVAGVIGTGTNYSTTSWPANIGVGGQRDLYFQLYTPVTSSVGTQQSFRVYVTAVP